METRCSILQAVIRVMIITLVLIFNGNAQVQCPCYSPSGESRNCETCYYGCFLSEKQCLKCPENCASCTSDSNCNTCKHWNHYGTTCQYLCSSCKYGNCDKTTCTYGCADGYYNYTEGTCKMCRPECNTCNSYSDCTACTADKYGSYCQYTCSNCKSNTCHKHNGQCTYGCADGYYQQQGQIRCVGCPRQCDKCYSETDCTSCNTGYYGPSCGFECDQKCRYNACNANTGECTNGCVDGYYHNGTSCLLNCPIDFCQTCSSDNKVCSVCNDGYYLFNGKCSPCRSGCLNGGVQSRQESVAKANNNGAVIDAATGSVIVVLIVVVLVIVFIMMRRKRQMTSNPEPDGMEGNSDKNRSGKKVESTALYAIPDKSTPVQPNSSTPGIFENGVYSNVEDIPSLLTIRTVNASEDGLEEINQDDIDKGTLADVEGPKVDNYYNIYGLTRSRIQLDKLNTYVSSKTTEGFEKEFKKLPEGLNRPYDDAVSPKNATKNRYKGIYPYDATRIKLEGNGGDYINASYIEGFGELEKTYIASLGPIKRFMKGYVDFWRMVWQENVDKIIMLTNFVEGTKEKCDKYWPEIGQTKTYGHVVVECINVEKFADFNISKLNVSTFSNSKTTTIHHFHFTSWPDRGTPSNVVSLVEFRESVDRVKSTTKGPTVVHCSAGIGRTGTYIALDILTREGQTEGYVDIFGCVLSLRGQRVGMVQNVDQYRYLHHAIEHSLTTECKQIENGNFCSVSADQIDERFNLLKAMKEYKEEVEIKAIEKNKKEKHKNRKGADIPGIGDVGRLKLSNHHKKTESQYINAVYVDSFKQSNKYILAQTPLTATVEDFLGLVLQENCSCIIALDDIEPTRKQDIGMYAPVGDKELTIGKFKVKVTNSESSPEYELRYITINVQGTGADEVKTIPHYQFTDWPANSPVPASVDSFLNLIRDTDRIVRDSGNEKGPILVHCLTGAERCGVIPVIANLIEKIGAEQQASVVNVTRQIRARRARAIPNKEQFQFSYSCVKQFVENSSVYANVL